MSLQVIPLTNSPNQQFTVLLQVDGAPLTLGLKICYNEMAGYWVMAIYDSSHKLLLDSIPLICGTYPAGNLLQQYTYLKIGSWYIINVANGVPNGTPSTGWGQGVFGAGPYGGEAGQAGQDYPDSTNLGTSFQLWVGDTPSV